jgi:hypothetical protein
LGLPEPVVPGAACAGRAGEGLPSIGVADCAYAEAAASNAALVINPKSFAISYFLLICTQRRAVEKVAGAPRNWECGSRLPPDAGHRSCCALVDRALVATARGCSVLRRDEGSPPYGLAGMPAPVCGLGFFPPRRRSHSVHGNLTRRYFAAV